MLPGLTYCLFSNFHNREIGEEEENNLTKIQSRTTTLHPTPTAARSRYRGILTNSILCFWLILIGAVSRQMKTLSPATRRGGHQRRRPCIGGGHRCRDHNKRARPLYADWKWSPVLAEIAFPFAYLHAITQSWQVNKNNNNDCRRWARAPKIFWWEVRWQLGLRFITNYFQTSSTRQIHQCLQMMIFLQKWSKSYLNTDYWQVTGHKKEPHFLLH